MTEVINSLSNVRRIDELTERVMLLEALVMKLVNSREMIWSRETQELIDKLEAALLTAVEGSKKESGDG